MSSNIPYELQAKFSLAIKKMVALYPSFMTFYSMCNKKPNPDVTLRMVTKIGITPIIEFNPEFIEAISPEALANLISMEMFRLILHHTTIRMMPPPDITMRASNIICSGPEILGLELSPEIRPYFPTADILKELDPTFDPNTEMWLERVFEILNKKDQDDKQNSGNNTDEIPGPGGMSSDGIPTNGNNPSDRGNNSDSNTNGNGNDGNSGTGNKKYQSEGDAIKDHFSKKNLIKNTEGWGKNDMIDEQVAQAVRNQSIKDWGKLPGNLVEQIREVNAEKFDAMAIIKNFYRSVMADWYRFSRMKVYRRCEELTGLFPGKIRGEQSKLLFALDVSRSMNYDQEVKGCEVVMSACKHAECYFCAWDAKCGDIVKHVPKSDEFELLGGGGTTPQCVIDKLEDEGLKFDGIVFITDNYYEWKEPDIRTRIFILGTDDSTEPPEWCQYHLTFKDIEKY